MSGVGKMKENSSKITSIDEYIAAFPESMQKLLRELRAAIKSAAPDAQEKISYQMPTFYLNGNLVHFAAYKGHIGFYPTPSAMEGFSAELAAYETSKGAVRFPLDQPLPPDLVRRITAFRVAENLAKSPSKRKSS